MSHPYSTRSRSIGPNGFSSASTTSTTSRRAPFRLRDMYSDQRLVRDPKDCPNRVSSTIQEMMSEAQQQQQCQERSTDSEISCWISYAGLILKPTTAIVCFCALAYGTMLLCQHLSALDELAGVKYQLCGLQKSFQRRLEGETKLRKCQEKKQIEDIKKIRTKIKDIEQNMQNISTLITTSLDDLKSNTIHDMEIYSADRTGKPDFALESAGGKIVNTRNTETFTLEEPTYFLGVIPLCQEYNTPSTIINPSVYPGECWAFEGSQGSVVIQLLGKVQITGVSLEHTTKLLAPTGDISTAPKDFSLWGLTDPDEQEGFFFGNFQYENNGVTVQYFDIIHPSTRPYNLVEFKVHSNHGHPEYTCVYRVRIHGNLDKTR